MNKTIRMTRTECWETKLDREELSKLMRERFNMNEDYEVRVTALTGSNEEVTGLMVMFSLLLDRREVPYPDDQRSGIVADDERTA